MAMPVDEHVLVVDSDPAARKTLESMLMRHGYSTRHAEGIAAALAAFEAEPSSVVIAAAVLRDGNGTDLIRALRQRAPDVAVILVGGRSWKAILAALRGATTDYLPKPVRAAELVSALERARRVHVAEAERAANERLLAAQLAQLQAAQSDLVQIASLAALGRLAANLAHEINNPLTPIFGMAELLLDDLPLDHQCRPYAESISASARRIRDVVRSLIDFACPSVHERTRIDLGALLHDTLLLTEQQLHDQEITTMLVLPRDPLIVMGSPAQLKQALLLLLDNAREAMPGGGQLRISLLDAPDPAPTRAGAPQPRRTVIAMSDTGVGIDEHRLPFIFEPFYSTKQQAFGVGLGLAVANGIVQEHGGVIEVDSAPGRGSTFRIILPAAPL